MTESAETEVPAPPPAGPPAAPDGAVHAPWWWRVWVALLAFSAVGLVDGSLAVTASEHALDVAWPALALSWGLWALLGVFVGLAQVSAWGLATGPGGRDKTLAALKVRLREIWSERGTAADRRRVALAVGALAGVGLVGVMSVLLLASLIANRHGPVLIAVTFVAAQVVLVFIAAVIGAGVCRLVDRLAQASTPLQGVLTTPMLAGALLAAAGLAALVVISRFWQTLIDVDAASLMGLPLVALLAQWPVARLLKGRTPRVVWPVGGLAVALAAVVASAQPAVPRAVVVETSYTARYILGAQTLSDFDGDGSPAFPVMQDCAPFDPDVHPYALEIGGNGVDEDCDGEDVAREYHVPAPRTHEIALPPGQPDLMLITIDSLRPDHLGFGGSDRPDISPNLDAFAASSTVFTQAFSQDSGTGPSLWSLMAGKTPFQTRIDNSGKFPPNFLPDEILLTEVLQAAGYRTEALLCGAVLDRKHWNLKRGFDKYVEICGKKVKEKQAERLSKDAVKTLKRLRKGKQPFFLWVHFYDPHKPYHDHPELDFGTSEKERYDEEIHYTDKHLGPLLSEVTFPYTERRTVVALTADHGENFGEHGTAPHARTLYREVTQVPLVMWATGLEPQVSDTTVALNDIHPTLLEFAGLDTRHSTMVSQVPAMYGHAGDRHRLVFQENSFSRPRRHAKGVVGRGHHLILDTTNSTSELYDLVEDPLEKKNLFGTGLAVEEQLSQALRAFIPTTSVPTNLAK